MAAAVLAGAAGGAAWLVGLVVFFAPAQVVLADPAHQSAKFLAVMGTIEPLPRIAGIPWALPVALLSIGIVYGFVYGRLRPALGAGALGRGLRFGVVAWALMAPWFEFYLPWNAMHEPAALVVLELALWLAVMLAVGTAIAGVYERVARRASRPHE